MYIYKYIINITNYFIFLALYYSILDTFAKATLHAICLTHLPVGCMRFTQFTQYDASFIDTVLRNFHVSQIIASSKQCILIYHYILFK